jgi:hypothetical protein
MSCARDGIKRRQLLSEKLDIVLSERWQDGAGLQHERGDDPVNTRTNSLASNWKSEKTKADSAVGQVGEERMQTHQRDESRIRWLRWVNWTSRKPRSLLYTKLVFPLSLFGLFNYSAGPGSERII